jgi:hypothetical protein
MIEVLPITSVSVIPVSINNALEQFAIDYTSSHPVANFLFHNCIVFTMGLISLNKGCFLLLEKYWSHCLVTSVTPVCNKYAIFRVECSMDSGYCVVGFEVDTAVVMKSTIFRDITPHQVQVLICLATGP